MTIRNFIDLVEDLNTLYGYDDIVGEINLDDSDNYKLIYNNGSYSFYWADLGYYEEKIVAVDNIFGEPVGFVKFFKTDAYPVSGYKIDSVGVDRAHTGQHLSALMYELIVDKYNVLYSDNSQTHKGTRNWKKIISNTDNFVYLFDGNDYLPIDKNLPMNSDFSEFPIDIYSKRDIIFVMSRNEINLKEKDHGSHASTKQKIERMEGV